MNSPHLPLQVISCVLHLLVVACYAQPLPTQLLLLCFLHLNAFTLLER